MSKCKRDDRWNPDTQRLIGVGSRTVVMLTVVFGAQAFAQAGAALSGAPPAPLSDEEKTDSFQLTHEPKLLKPLPPPSPDAPPPPADPRDFQGTWVAQSMLVAGPNAPMPPLTAKAAERFRYRMEMNAKGTPLASLAARCRPFSAIGIGADLFPAQIVQSKDKIVIFNEEGRSRWVIPLDQEQPKNPAPTYWGHSVGHWEGNTLVVDTVGFNGTADDRSTKAHVVSKIQKLGDGRHLQIHTTVTDPETYSKPYEQTAVSLWNPEVRVLEFQCEENMEGAAEGLTFEKK